MATPRAFKHLVEAVRFSTDESVHNRLGLRWFAVVAMTLAMTLGIWLGLAVPGPF